jgi:hypothetical protein
MIYILSVIKQVIGLGCGWKIYDKQNISIELSFHTIVKCLSEKIAGIYSKLLEIHTCCVIVQGSYIKSWSYINTFIVCTLNLMYIWSKKWTTFNFQISRGRKYILFNLQHSLIKIYICFYWCFRAISLNYKLLIF